ncbi:type II/IV secretion system ATPase subunit [Methanolobus sediminis]|uniref:Type II/IV secretion system ATPase subunit n=1 Tax=Methanolobus sediminis TaxID=3072978 RepID=A0AA51YJK0_9EURY|nr:type II/IV secretion system ATPase subunit [Methanolobus sediminis]WMW25676.1 type II/IV secretion system ATPase subunit [Methanolobus sediminis]
MSINNNPDDRTATTENADDIDTYLQTEIETSENEEILEGIKESNAKPESSLENTQNDILLDDSPIEGPVEDVIQEDSITDETDDAETEEIPIEEETIYRKTSLSGLSGHEIVADDVQEDETESLAVDEDDVISELADLILPDAEPVNIADLKSKIDDVNIPSFQDNIEVDRDSFWKDTILEIYKEEPIEEELFVEEEKGESILDRINKLLPSTKIELEPYNVVEHGPIVDLTIPEGSPYKEVELYEVNPLYAYVRIAYDPEAHEYQYQVIESVLTEKERELLETIKLKFIETLDVNLKEISRKNAEEFLRDNVGKYLQEFKIDISPRKRERIMYHIVRDYVGYGEIDVLMRDPNLEDISCDGPNTPVYIYHKEYNSIPTDIVFPSDNILDSFAIRIAQICGRHISIARPLLDATMPDGSRIQMTLGREITTRGTTFTIRRFKDNPITPANLIEYHTFSTAMMAYMWLAVESNKSLVFAGGTASGKTTAMNAVSLFILPEMKIVSIEDTRELNLSHPNWIPGVTRQAFTGDDKGSIEMYELLRASLRQRPEYILVGEVRGAEAYVLFQAMSTGHTTFSTMHADSVQSVVHRLENPPINVPRIMIQALDLVAIQVQVKVGDERVRRCKSLTEIVGVDPRTGELLTNDVFVWDAARDMFQYSGRSYIIESVMESRGWAEEKVRDELKRRQDILEWTREKKITHFKDFAKIVIGYNREPEMIMKLVRQELHG